MQSLSGALRGSLAYVFVAVGVAWLGVVYATGSALVLWPALACLLSGVLLRTYPASRLASAWASSSAVMGLVLSAYQVYVAAPLLSGEFATIAGASIVAFLVFSVLHLYLLTASGSVGTVK